MILFYEKINIGKILIEKIKKVIGNDEFIHNNFYTSYFGETEIDGILNFYSPIMDKILKKMSLYHRSSCRWYYWVQMYNNKTEGHHFHDHFDQNTILSWVHFADIPSRQKCFYFLDSEGNKFYPKTQCSGDFIVFPSWAMHGVDKFNSDKNRIVVSGNILLDKIDCGESVYEYKK